MEFEFEIMWDDLTEEKKQEIRDKAREEGFILEEDDRNWDIFPITTIVIGDDDD